MAQVQPILVNGEWIQSVSEKTFKAVNPATKEEHHISFPVRPSPCPQPARLFAFPRIAQDPPPARLPRPPSAEYLAGVPP